MHRAIRGDCVAWKPEMAPQAMETNIIGKMGFANELSDLLCSPCQNSGTAGCLTYIIIIMPKAMISRQTVKSG